MLRKLIPGKSTVNEVILQLPQNITPDLDNNDDFSMMIFSKECEQGVCGRHYLLVSYEPEHLLHLQFVPAELSCVSELKLSAFQQNLQTGLESCGQSSVPVPQLTDHAVVVSCALNELE